MAMIKCPICGYEISSTDTKCIKCGSDQYTIQFELKKKDLIAKGKIKDTTRKKKNVIIAIELIFIILAVVAYINFFLPSIIDITHNYVKEEKEKKCISESGSWNADLNECIEDTEVFEK